MLIDKQNFATEVEETEMTSDQSHRLESDKPTDLKHLYFKVVGPWIRKLKKNIDEMFTLSALVYGGVG
jgi:hypothetical protein